MMDFTEAFNVLAIGERVRVSNGQTLPTKKRSGQVYMEWRSHNFTGTVQAKLERGGKRILVTMDPDENGSVIGYEVGDGHQFIAQGNTK